MCAQKELADLISHWKRLCNGGNNTGQSPAKRFQLFLRKEFMINGFAVYWPYEFIDLLRHTPVTDFLCDGEITHNVKRLREYVQEMRSKLGISPNFDAESSIKLSDEPNPSQRLTMAEESKELTATKVQYQEAPKLLPFE